MKVFAGYLLALGLLAEGTALVAEGMTADLAEGRALQCARTLDEPTDSNIVRCFTDAGLPAPEDLT